MPDQGQRDRAIEHVLRRGAGAAQQPAGLDACVDGETLAAWSSGVLPQADAARVEEHLADCARCQSMLAAFARTEPLVETQASWLAGRSVSGWRGERFRWLVPFAAAAVVAAIWMTAPQRDEAPPTLADSRAPAAAESPAVQSKPAPSQPPASLSDQTASTRTTQTAPPKREADAARERSEGFMVRRDAKPAEGARAADSRIAAERPPAPPAAASPTPLPVSETVAIAPETRQLLLRAAAAEFGTPDGSMRWRIIGGQVHRSTTQGKSWEAVTLPSDVTITAGHAPAGSIAWVVGRAGAIFVTTDGTRFERVPFPQAVDIVSILAIDGRQATVTTVDGRVFGTSDRGVTWISP